MVGFALPASYWSIKFVSRSDFGHFRGFWTEIINFREWMRDFCTGGLDPTIVPDGTIRGTYSNNNIYRKIGGKVWNGLAFPKKRFRFYENHSGFGQLCSVAFQLERAQKLPRGCEFFLSGYEKLCIMIVLMYLNHQNTIYCRISISARVLVLKSPAKLFRATGRSTREVSGCGMSASIHPHVDDTT